MRQPPEKGSLRTFRVRRGFQVLDACNVLDTGKDALREDTVDAKYIWDLSRSCVVEEIRTAGFYKDRQPYRLADSKTIELLLARERINVFDVFQ